MSGVKRILIVDDEDFMRNVISLILKTSGVELDIVEANNGNMALDILKSGKFHLLLTDLIMPGMGGIDLCNAAEKAGIAIPVILMSGSFDERRMNELKEKGFTAIPKPFSTIALQSAVFKSLGMNLTSPVQAGAAV